MMPSTPPLGSPDASREAPREAPPTARDARRYGPWLALVAVAVAALAYGVGRLQGAMALSRATEESTKALQTGQAQLAACGADRQLLEARRSLSLVALSLDRRNFGVAETHRRSALQHLEQPALSGVPKVAGLATTVRAVDLAVDPDPGAKREQVIAVTEALDGILAARGGRAPEPVVRAEQP